MKKFKKYLLGFTLSTILVLSLREFLFKKTKNKDEDDDIFE